MTYASHRPLSYNVDWDVLTREERERVTISIFNDGAAYGRQKALEEVKFVIDDQMLQTPHNGTLRFPIMRPLAPEFFTGGSPFEGPSWDVIELNRDHWAVIKYLLTGKS